VPQFMETVTPEAESLVDESDNYTDVSDSSVDGLAHENHSLDDGVYPLPDSASETSGLRVSGQMAQTLQKTKELENGTASHGLQSDVFSLRSKLCLTTDGKAPSCTIAQSEFQDRVDVSESPRLSLEKATTAVLSPLGDTEPDSGVLSLFSGSIDVRKYANSDTKNNFTTRHNFSKAPDNSLQQRDTSYVFTDNQLKGAGDSAVVRRFDDSHATKEDGASSSDDLQEEEDEHPLTMQVVFTFRCY